ncbi:rhomboid-related protein 2-like isoform X1 [Macrobrachium nipponense]|uniref:rhomboid-related protein 2-like isoform X1 n=1 Tax=Macrobrachium nipponense TaxID=159736 RepID=UPI0030C80601
MARIEPMESVGEMSPIPKWILVKAHDFWNRQDVRKDKKIPMQQVKESLLMTDESNRIPNALVIELLRKADENEDGYLDYDEYMKFAEAASTRSRGRDTFSRAAMTIIPRNERTVEKRTYFQNYSCCPPPFFMVLATFVETGVFVYYMVDMGEKMEAAGPAPIYSPLIYNPKRRYECWRYLSYALIHSGYMHLINNLVVQFVLGIILEVVHGWWRIGTIYLSGVLFGALAQSISDPDSYLAGASAGVFSVEYAHLGNMLMNWSQMEFRWLQLVVIIVLSFSDVGFAVWDIYFNGNKTKTGHAAHLGGAIAGMTVGTYILRNFEKRKWEKYCWWASLLVYLVLIAVGIILSATLPVPGYFPYNDNAPIWHARTYFFEEKNRTH